MADKNEGNFKDSDKNDVNIKILTKNGVIFTDSDKNGVNFKILTKNGVIFTDSVKNEVNIKDSNGENNHLIFNWVHPLFFPMKGLEFMLYRQYTFNHRPYWLPRRWLNILWTKY